MADVNYVSPASLRPNVQGQAQLPAFLQGMQYNTELRDYDKSAALSQLMSQLALQKQSEDMVMGAPVRQGERQASMATNQAITSTIGDLKRGQADLSLTQGGVARATMQSDIATKLAKNAVDQGEAGVAQLRTGAKFGQLLSQFGGPQAAAQIEQLGKQFNLPQEIIRAAMADPQKTQQLLLAADDKLQALLVSDTNKEGLQNYGRMQVQQLANQQSDVNNRRTTSAQMGSASNKMSQDQLASDLERQIMAYEMAGKPVPPQIITALNRLREREIGLRTASAQQTAAQLAAVLEKEPPAVVAKPVRVGPEAPAAPKTSFKDMQEVQQALNAGQLKKGQAVMVGGKPFRAQ